MQTKTSFVLVFGVSPTVRVLDFLIDNQEFDYNLTEIAQGAEVGWTTLHQFWPGLVKLGLVRQTRTKGRAVLYKLNLENALVKKLLELDLLISKQMAISHHETVVAA